MKVPQKKYIYLYSSESAREMTRMVRMERLKRVYVEREERERSRIYINLVTVLYLEGVDIGKMRLGTVVVGLLKTFTIMASMKVLS